MRNGGSQPSRGHYISGIAGATGVRASAPGSARGEGPRWDAGYVEDLCVAGLGRTRLAKSVHDAGWAGFTAMLEYKAAQYGRTSTRMCSACGRINEKMALAVRAWDCPCGAAHDRDVNAALNVLAAGQADNSNDRGAQVRPGPVPAPRGEAVTHPDAASSTRSVEGSSVLQAGEDVNFPGSAAPR
jgi:putative transposase